jgi:hypothetical protein
MSEEQGLSYIAKPLKLSTSSVALRLIHGVKNNYYDLNFLGKEVKVRVSPSAYDGLLSLIDKDRIIVNIKDGKVRNAVQLPQLDSAGMYRLVSKLTPWPLLGFFEKNENYELLSRTDLIDNLVSVLKSEIPFRWGMTNGRAVPIGTWLNVRREMCLCCSKLIIKDMAWDHESETWFKVDVETVLACIYLHYRNITPSGLFTASFESKDRIVVKSKTETFSFSTYDVFKDLHALVERLLIEKKEVLA